MEEAGPDGWPTVDAALAEVRKSLQPDRLSRIACEPGAPSWAGLAPYHTIVAACGNFTRWSCVQGGRGRVLAVRWCEDIERQVQARGAVTLQLGADDTDGRTTLFGADLYPDVWAHVTAIRNLGRHPYEFYQKLGFVITGVVPDANGLGKPDILMAKRVCHGPLPCGA